MKGHHDINIMKVGDTYRVRPAVWSSNGKKATGKQHAELKIRNLTDCRVQVVLPAILIAGEPREIFLDPKDTPTPNPNPNLDGDPPEVRTAKLVSKDAGNSAGVYPYSVIVYTGQGTTIAVGESDPVVIIDPPPA